MLLTASPQAIMEIVPVWSLSVMSQPCRVSPSFVYVNLSMFCIVHCRSTCCMSGTMFSMSRVGGFSSTSCVLWCFCA